MFKVISISKRLLLPTSSGLYGGRMARSCQICGNGFFPLSANARTCELCKTPFASHCPTESAESFKDAAAGA